MVRTFIGIELENSVMAEISEEISYLQCKFPDINWVRRENLHLTLKFLGNVQPNDLRNIFNDITALENFASPFSIDITGINLLPDIKHPRIVCAGCNFGRNELVRLHSRIDEICHNLGYPVEQKPYSPHVTLGRIKKPSFAKGFEEYLSDLSNVDFGITDVDEVVVYMSELGNKGALYSPMYRVRLG